MFSRKKQRKSATESFSKRKSSVADFKICFYIDLTAF
jgi:hypothetical protein